MEDIIVEIKPKHFAASNGWSHGPGKCPLEQALVELYPESRVHVGAFYTVIDSFHYDIINWGATGKENNHKINNDDESDWPVDIINTLAKRAKQSLTDIPTVSVTLRY